MGRGWYHGLDVRAKKNNAGGENPGGGGENPGDQDENLDNSTAFEKNKSKNPKTFDSNAQHTKNKKKKKKKSHKQCCVNSE